MWITRQAELTRLCSVLQALPSLPHKWILLAVQRLSHLAKVMCIQGGNVTGKSNQVELLLDLLILMLILQLLNPLNQSR